MHSKKQEADTQSKGRKCADRTNNELQVTMQVTNEAPVLILLQLPYDQIYIC